MSKLYLIVRLAGDRVAVPAEDVEAVVEIEAVTAVPRTAPHVAGLAALRSRVLTVIDCQASLGIPPTPIAPRREAMVVVADGHPYALLVDAVEDVVEAPGDIVPVRASLAPGWRRVSRGIVEAETDLMLVLDVKTLIAGPAAAAA